jgi:hypothetical protein
MENKFWDTDKVNEDTEYFNGVGDVGRGGGVWVGWVPLGYDIFGKVI